MVSCSVDKTASVPWPFLASLEGGRRAPLATAGALEGVKDSSRVVCTGAAGLEGVISNASTCISTSVSESLAPSEPYETWYGASTRAVRGSVGSFVLLRFPTHCVKTFY